MENEEFLEKINSTEKKLGNNKFQEQIEELKKQLVDYEHKTTQDKETNDNLQKNKVDLDSIRGSSLSSLSSVYKNLKKNALLIYIY